MAETKWNNLVATRIIAAIPVIGFTGTVIVFLGVGSQAFQLPLQSIVGTGVLSNKMAGWDEFAAHTKSVLLAQFESDSPIIVTDNYYTAAQVEFARISQEVYTLDRDKAVRDGRITQYELWNKDEAGMEFQSDRPVLYINEDSTLTVSDKHDLLALMCRRVDQLNLVDELSLYNGDKAFSFYRANRLISEASNRAQPCPFPPRAWIDFPAENDVLSGVVNVSGWAYNEDIGIDSVELIIDGAVVGRTNYGMSRPDVVTAMDLSLIHI